MAETPTTTPEEAVRRLLDEVAALKAQNAELRGALPIIVFGLAYFDVDEHGEWERAFQAWHRSWKPALEQEHSGDCTNESHACFRCQAEDCLDMAAQARAVLERHALKEAQDG